MMGDSNRIKMSRKRWCFIPGCTNTSINNPEKLFISVPTNLEKKKRWFTAAKRELKDVSIKTHFYCCEDHFVLEKDMDNYVEYRLSNVKIRMRPEALPHIFTCQQGTKMIYQSHKKVRKRDISEKETVMYKADFCCQANLTEYSSKGIQVSCLTED